MIVQKQQHRQFYCSTSRRRYLTVAIAFAVSLVCAWMRTIGEDPYYAYGSSSSLLSLESLDPATTTTTTTTTNTTTSSELLLVNRKTVEMKGVPRIGRNNNKYPPLSSLLQAVPAYTTIATDTTTSTTDTPKTKVQLEIIGDVQFLLDYVIMGFSKCGTTTLLKWLRRDPDVRTFPRELHEITSDHGNPGALVERLYHNLVVAEDTNSSVATRRDIPSLSSTTLIQGFKNPEILQQPVALQHLHHHWPQTKLIVSVRNPLKWFRSFYNFRLTLGHLELVGRDPNALVGDCGSRRRHHQGSSDAIRRMLLCTHMGAFHAKLFRLGKTNMSTQAEFDLVQPYLMDPMVGNDDADIWNQIHTSIGNTNASIPRMTNQIFFMDVRQLSDSNRTRSKQLRQDLQNFLGLQHDLSPVFRARPFKQLEFMPDANASKPYKIASICDADKYLPLQTELLGTARAASVWLRTYFLTSPDVMVSSPEYLDQLLETWMENPCLGDNNNGGGGKG